MAITEQISIRVPPWVKDYLREAAHGERTSQTAIFVDAVKRRREAVNSDASGEGQDAH